jgi:ketosteroid isomerase-like protein
VSNQNGDIQTFLSRWTDAERQGDKVALSLLLTDDFLGVGPMGFVLQKQAWLDRYGEGGLQYDKFELDEVQVHQHGDSTTVTARINQQGTIQGHPTPAAARATLLVVDQPNGKQLAGISLTFIAGTPGAPPLPGPPQ